MSRPARLCLVFAGARGLGIPLRVCSALGIHVDRRLLLWPTPSSRAVFSHLFSICLSAVRFSQFLPIVLVTSAFRTFYFDTPLGQTPHLQHLSQPLFSSVPPPDLVSPIHDRFSIRRQPPHGP